MQDRVREALQLQSIDMRIRTERAMVLPIMHSEAFHLTGAQIPGIEGLAKHAAVLPVHLEALMPVHAHCHRQIKVTYTAIGEFCGNKPAVGSKFLDEPGLHAHNFTSQIAGSIDEMASV